MTGAEKCKIIMSEINKVIIGKEAIIKNVLAAIIAEGHVLLEDIPGVGKTTLAMTFSKGFFFLGSMFSTSWIPLRFCCRTVSSVYNIAR